MIYEIINPSDKYTIEADDLKIAVRVCIALGRGVYCFGPWCVLLWAVVCMGYTTQILVSLCGQ